MKGLDLSEEKERLFVEVLQTVQERKVNEDETDPAYYDGIWPI